MQYKTRRGNRSLSPIFQAGFTYLAVLITVAVMAAGLTAAATIYSQVAQREKEVELLFVGDQYRQAIMSYYERAPGGAKRYPQKLEDLLEDNRFATVTRHLRRIYKDPITGQDMVPVEAPGGGIMGVASASEAPPVKTAGFRPRDDAFVDAQHYADWKFAYSPPGLSVSQPGNNTNSPKQ